jgi:hypothetical protein
MVVNATHIDRSRLKLREVCSQLRLRPSVFVAPGLGSICCAKPQVRSPVSCMRVRESEVLVVQVYNIVAGRKYEFSHWVGAMTSGLEVCFGDFIRSENTELAHVEPGRPHSVVSAKEAIGTGKITTDHLIAKCRDSRYAVRLLLHEIGRHVRVSKMLVEIGNDDPVGHADALLPNVVEE